MVEWASYRLQGRLDCLQRLWNEIVCGLMAFTFAGVVHAYGGLQRKFQRKQTILGLLKFIRKKLFFGRYRVNSGYFFT